MSKKDGGREVVPKGWREKPIGELFAISGGISASRAQLSDCGYFYLHYGDIHAATKQYIDTDADRNEIPHLDVPISKVANASLLCDGDVVFVDASEDDAGASRHIVVRNKKELPFIAGLHTVVAKSLTNKICNAFREYCFQTERVKRQFKQYAAGTKVTGISKNNIKKIVIQFPQSLSEQRAIAAALSDADSYIAALEKLIAKKRNIKQGAMQELLKPKDGWEEKALFELVPNLRMGQSPNSIYYNEEARGLPLIQGNADIKNRKTIIRAYTSQITKRASKGDIILTVRAPVGNIAKATVDCCLGRGVCGFSYPNEYLYHWFVYFEPNWNSLSTGSTFDSISGDELKNVTITLPPLPEQSRIAAILSDMDAEIEALTAKLSKAKSIKQGMMQELLTGRIRLVKPQVIAVPVTKVVDFPKQEKTSKGHNQAIEDAVVISTLASKFGTELHPFTAFDCQKFPYLFHRHVEGTTEGYKKFAAGPYNPGLKYRTARPIALKKRYIRECTSLYKGFVTDVNVQEALDYFAKWYGDEPLKWMEQFRRINNRRDELELLTTVDMAMVELRHNNEPVNVIAVKKIIQNSPEWKAKLKREIFSDANIARAIKWSDSLFGQEVNDNA